MSDSVIFGPDYVAAMEGDNAARQRERERMKREGRTYDLRDKGMSCGKVDIHDPHDHDEMVWEPPQWVNPRTIWKKHCPGVADQTPYPSILKSNEKGVWVFKQDVATVPDSGFPLVRRLMATPAWGQDGVVVINTEIHRRPPREWPPFHVGDNGAGVALNREETVALRDYLTFLIEEDDDV